MLFAGTVSRDSPRNGQGMVLAARHLEHAQIFFSEKHHLCRAVLLGSAANLCALPPLAVEGATPRVKNAVFRKGHRVEERAGDLRDHD